MPVQPPSALMAVAISGDGAGAEKLPLLSSNFPLPSLPSLMTVTHATASSACHVGPDHDLFDGCLGSILNIICYLTYQTPTRISVYIRSYTSMPFTLHHFLIVSSHVVCHPLTCELRVPATSGLHFGTPESVDVASPSLSSHSICQGK